MEHLVRATSLGDQLAATLRMQIVQGTIAVGTHLVEDTIADQFNVSRGPVRDALKLLRLDHLVEPVGRRGLRVIGLELDDVRDLYEVRLGIELMAVHTLQQDPASWRFIAMRAAITGMQDAMSHGEVDQFAAWDLRFHREIYVAAGSRRLLGFWDQIEPLFACMLSLTNREDDDLNPVVADHVALLNQLSNGDGAGAERAIRDHLQGSEKRITLAMQRSGNTYAGQVL